MTPAAAAAAATVAITKRSSVSNIGAAGARVGLRRPGPADRRSLFGGSTDRLYNVRPDLVAPLTYVAVQTAATAAAAAAVSLVTVSAILAAGTAQPRGRTHDVRNTPHPISRSE